MIDDIFVVYENAGKIFPSYREAWNNHYKSCRKQVNYVFTPTGKICKNVGELHRTADKYFKSIDCTYIDVLNKNTINQLNLF